MRSNSLQSKKNVDQGYLGRLLGFGRITIRGTGIDDVDIPPIADPLRFSLNSASMGEDASAASASGVGYKAPSMDGKACAITA